jgi:predicted outer membrane protein
MSDATAVAALNRLFQILYRSLPCYLDGPRPFFAQEGDQRAVNAVASLAADQRSYASRLSDAILARGGAVEPGHFPMRFTAFNDLKTSYLVDRVIEFQKKSVPAIEACMIALADVPDLQALADEILGNAQGHLENLEEIAAQAHSAVSR